MNVYGLLGKSLSHSFSRKYFSEKFSKLGLADYSYLNFELASIAGLSDMLSQNPQLRGFNVTIPYKRDIIPYLTEVSSAAAQIGAVNTVLVTPQGLIGDNTDHTGFSDTLDQLGITTTPADALILGTGGASAAVAYVFEQRAQSFKFVSRTPSSTQLSYASLEALDWGQPRLIVNTTPVGTSPNVEDLPEVPVHRLGAQHSVVDLIYNPAKTLLLREAKSKGAQTVNGLPMLQSQAEAAWKLWTAALPDTLHL